MRMMYAFLSVLLGFALVYGAYRWRVRDGAFTKTHTIDVSGDRVRIEVRDTMLGRAQGLSGRTSESLGEDDGMLFVFASSSDYGFWMKDMLFEIDIIWIGEEKVAEEKWDDAGSGVTTKMKIVSISENAAPEPEKSLMSLTIYHPAAPVAYVLEVHAGTAARNGWKAGDEVKF
mgnify:CR=1 FL=1